MNLQQLVIIDTLAARSYKKCGLCGRVRNLFYRMTIKDAKTGSMVVGSLLLCDQCGNNFGDMLGKKLHSEPRPRMVNL